MCLQAGANTVSCSISTSHLSSRKSEQQTDCRKITPIHKDGFEVRQQIQDDIWNILNPRYNNVDSESDSGFEDDAPTQAQDINQFEI